MERKLGAGHIDVRMDKPVSRPVVNFHTAAALEEKFAFNDSRSRQWLLDTPPERITRLRPYQVASIVATESAMLAGKRELLVAMATGTGKTFLTVAQIYRLLESKKFRRILFLDKGSVRRICTNRDNFQLLTPNFAAFFDVEC